MNLRRRSKLCLTALAFLPGLALSQELTDVDAAPEVRRYTVEMIIFSYAEDVSIGSEIFAPDKPPTSDPLAIEPPGDGSMAEAGDRVAGDPLVSLPQFVGEEDVIADTSPALDAEEDTLLEELEVQVPGPYNPYAPRRLEADNFELLDIAAHLSRLDAYEPMLHFGWTQAMVADEGRESRPLRSFVTPPDGLRGDLSLYLSRYLHLAVNLEWDADPADDSRASNDSDAYGDSRFGRYDDGRYDDPTQYPGTGGRFPVIYRIDEDRIFKNGDLRYFDHPKFGVLAKVTRIEEEETDDSADEELGEMLGDGELLGDVE